MADCKGCGGTGKCSTCDGKGTIMSNSTIFTNKCKKCDGSGNCTVCNGTGKN